MDLKTYIKNAWKKLATNKDEFSKDLDIDLDYILTLNEEETREYLEDLYERRRVAHDRDLT